MCQLQYIIYIKKQDIIDLENIGVTFMPVKNYPE